MKNDKKKKKSVKSSKKQNKYRTLSLVLTSTLVIAPLTVPLSFYLPGGITASAAVLDAEILSNITSSNNSGTTTANRWAADGTSKNVNFTISGEELVGGSVITSGRKQAVLAIPNELKGRVSLNGAAHINTNITVTVSELAFLSATMTAVNNLSTVLTQIADGVFGSLTGVNINLTTVNQKIAALKNLSNFGSASFNATPVLSADGSYITANIDDGLGLVLAQNVSTILQDLKSAVNALNATGTNIPSNIVASAINVALSPVKLAADVAISAAIPLVGIGGAGVNQLADASVLGSTTVTLPTSMASPQNLTQNLNARFVGTVVKTDVIDIGLIRTANGVSDIYYAGTAAIVAPPVVTNTTGTSQTGYTVNGTATAGNTVDIRNAGGTTIGTGVANGNGNFSITIPQGQAGANQALKAIAKNGTAESTPTSFTTPADPIVVVPPIVTKTIGTSQTGYTVTGTATAGNKVDIRNAGGTTIGTSVANASGNFSITIPQGQAGASEVLKAIAKNGATESTPTSFTTPADPIVVTPPVITKTTGTSQTGYTVTGTARANDTVDIRNANGTTIGTGIADGSGNFTISIPQGQATANQSLHAVAKVGPVESTPISFTTPADPITVNAPTIDSVTGTSLTGHTVRGKAPVGTQVQIRNAGGTVIGKVATNNAGDFEIVLPVGLTTANQDLSAIAIDENNNQSQETSFETPADPVAVTAPIVSSVTGNSTSGYTVAGTATAGNTVEIRNTGGTVIGSAITNNSGNYSVILPIGSATPTQQLKAIAKDGDGNQSPATSFTTPADPVEITAPTVNTVIGNSTTGYTVTGTATAGNMVEIRNTGGTVIGSGISNSSGNFTITLPTGAATPSQQLHAIAKDGDGNTSSGTPFMTPVDPIVVTTPTVSNVTGSSTSGYTITGTATTGNTVDIRNTGGTIIGSGIADGDGNFTITLPTGTATPSQQLHAIAKDSDGNTSTATPFTIPVDPVVVSAPTVNNVTGNSTSGYTIKGTATAGNTVEIRNTGGTIIGTTTADSSGNYTVIIPIGLATPTQQLSVVAKDSDGNQSPATLFTTPVDPVTVTSPTVNSVTGNSTTGYTVKGIATAGNTVEVRNTGGTVIGTVIADLSGNYTVTIPVGLVSPSQQLHAIAKDSDSNQSPATLFTTPADPVVVTAPKVDNIVGSSTAGYTITGTAPEGSSLEIKNTGGTVIGSGVADSDGNYTVTLPAGTATPNQQLTVTAKDEAGNSSPGTTFFTPADLVIISAPTVNNVSGNSTTGYSVKGTATSGNTVNIKNTGGTVIGTAVVDSSGNYTVTIPAGLATPKQQLNAVAQDNDGNQSPATPFTTPTDPVIIAAPTVDSITGNSTTGYTVTGTANAGNTVEVRNTGGTVLGSVIADETGNYVIILSTGTATPSQQLTVVAKDGDGNQSPATSFVTPTDSVVVSSPGLTNVSGNSSSGYTVTGTAVAGNTVEIRNTGGTIIGSSIVGEDGNFTVILPAGTATPSQQLTAIAKDGDGNQSPATPFTTPADPVVITAPTVDNVTGNSSSGYTITGNAPADSSIEIRNTGGTVIGSSTFDGSGNYTVTIPAGSANPSEQLTVVAKDADGNTSPATPFTTPADPVVIAAPTVENVSGNSSTGYTVIGTALARSTVEIKNTGGTVIGSSIADGSGNFTVTIPVGSATPNEELAASAKDNNGNTSPETSFTTPADPVMITAPTIENVTGTAAAGYTVTGTATAGHTVEIRNTGGTILGATIVDESGNFVVVLPIGSTTAKQQLNALAKDDDGNQSTATPFVTPGDPVGIVAPIVDSVTGNSESGYTIKGIAIAGSTVEVRNTNGSVIGTGPADQNGNYTIIIPAGLAGENEQLTAVTKDEDGNTSPATPFVTPADPEVIVATPVISKVTGNSLTGYTIFGKETPGNTVRIYNADDFLLGQAVANEAGTNEAGTFIITVPIGLAHANEQLSAIALDPDGNQSSPASFKLPSDPATEAISAPIVENVTGSSTTGYNVNGTADPGTIVDIYNVEGNKVGSSKVDEDGDFDATILPGMVKPNEEDTAVARDNNGNHSEPTSFVIPSDPGTGNNGNTGGNSVGNGTGTNRGTTSGSQSIGGSQKNLPNNGEIISNWSLIGALLLGAFSIFAIKRKNKKEEE